MSGFSIVPFPEAFGDDTVRLVTLKGKIFDFFGNPVETDVEIGLNKRSTGYKEHTQLSGAAKTVSTETDGSWNADLPDSFNMTPDAYYEIAINEFVFRKNLPDYPPETYLNELEDYS
jgi:hypothetical protein